MSSTTTVQNFLTREECKNLVDYSLYNLSLEPGLVRNNELVEKVRKSKIAFYDYEDKFDWLFLKIKEYVEVTFPIKGYKIKADPRLQFTEYSVGEHYNWHQDDGEDSLTAERYRSIVIQLSDNYSGGFLEYKENGTKRFENGIGSLFTFPSYYSHRVTEVTSGVRYSLVGWFKLVSLQNNVNTLI